MNTKPVSQLIDRHGRQVTYLRVSLTDRCNLRCFYCRSTKDFSLLPHQDILRYEELLSLLRLLPAVGIRKIRLTGGEPLVRQRVLPFIEQVLGLGFEVGLTTNGVLLAQMAPELGRLGLKRVNISLDTLRRDQFAAITGSDAYLAVRQGIDASLAAGMAVKLNAVALRGINDVELPDFLHLANDLGIEVRFIEFMPMGDKTAWRKESFWPAADILAAARQHADLDPLPRNESDHAGPARSFTLRGGPGRFGIIAPLTEHFCGTCNRLRLTSDGNLRTCLYADKVFKLRPIIRHPALGPEAALRVMERATRIKPMGYVLLNSRRQNIAVCDSIMSGIGG